MLKIAAIAAGVVLVLLVLFIVWRWTSVGRGMRQRDERLLVRLDPLAKRMETGQAVSPQEVETVAAGHWASKDGWILGLAGPMRRNVEPYFEMPGAFSRVGDLEGKVKPSELVDWHVGMLRQKGMIE